MKILDAALRIFQDGDENGRMPDGTAGKIHFVGNAAIDVDGAPTAYGPDNTGLDYTANAGHAGNWFGVETDNGRRDGNPVTQIIDGKVYYKSDTTLHLDGQPIDASKVPGVVIPLSLRKNSAGIVMGCKGRVTRISTGVGVDVVPFDEGPSKDWDGEVSPPVAEALGFDADPRDGGLPERDLLFEFWPDVAAVVDGVTYPLQAL